MEEIRSKKTENLQEIKEVLMWCNGWSYKRTEGLWSDLLAEIQILAEGLLGTGANYGKTETANEFIANICNNVRKFNKCSEKQAFMIARYADQNGILISDFE